MTALRKQDGGAPTLPLSVLLSAIPSLPRPLLSRLVARAIEHLDEQDGDPDLEENDAEDAFAFTPWALQFLNDGPGCPISDPGGDDAFNGELELEDVGWVPTYGIDQRVIIGRRRV